MSEVNLLDSSQLQARPGAEQLLQSWGAGGWAPLPGAGITSKPSPPIYTETTKRNKATFLLEPIPGKDLLSLSKKAELFTGRFLAISLK